MMICPFKQISKYVNYGMKPIIHYNPVAVAQFPDSQQIQNAAKFYLSFHFFSVTVLDNGLMSLHMLLSRL
jgi:hypothetical protein